MLFWLRFLKVVVAVSCLALLDPRHALAQRRPPSEAIRLYERARERYVAHDYEGAAALLERAVAIDPDSSTLAYNLARAYEESGDRTRARAYYQRVIETTPEGNEDHQQSVAGLARLDASSGATPPAQGNTNTATLGASNPNPNAASPTAVAATNGRVPHGDQRFDAWFVLTLGVGVLSAAAAGAFGILALVNNSEVSNFVIGRDGEIGVRDNKVVNAINFALVSDILTGVSVAFLTTSLLLVLLREGPLTAEDIAREQAQGHIDLQIGLGSVALSGAF